MTPTLALSATMMAARFYGPGQLRVESVALPAPGPGELVVRMDTALTCGTDVKCLRRGHPVLLKSFPSPFGHEGAGTVVAVGLGVTRFAVGDRVVCANSAPCETCYYCSKGQFNLCESLDLLNGTYAEYLIVPERIARLNTYRLPDTLPFETAAFAEPLAVALRGVALSHVKPGDAVAVLGLGPIGQLLVRVLTLQGAYVTTMARNPQKLAMAQAFGQAQQVVNIAEGLDVAAIRAGYSPQGRGFDRVIEAIGLPETWEKSLGLVRKGGLVNLFGGCPGGSMVNLDTRRLHYDEITLVSLFHHTPEYFRQAVDMLATGQLNPIPLISDTLPLSQCVEALARVEAGQAFKIALKP